MVGAFGEVLVMDWGLAQDWGPAVGSPGGNPGGHAAAAPGSVKGTPAYMAPEQARGEPADARADVFALGGVLAAVLTGEAPFVGTNVLDTILRSAAADLAGCAARLDGCGADPDLVALAKWCLAARPGDRPADGAAVAAAVAGYRAGVDERLRRAERERAAAGARAGEQRKRRRVQLALAAVALLALALGACAVVWEGERREADRDFRRAVEGRAATERALGLLAEEQGKTQGALAAATNARADAEASRRDAVRARDFARQQFATVVERYTALARDIDLRLAEQPGLQALRKRLLLTAADGLRELVSRGEGATGPSAMLVETRTHLCDLYQLVGETKSARREAAEAVRLARLLTGSGADAQEERAAVLGLCRSLRSLSQTCSIGGDSRAALDAIDEAVTLLEGLDPQRAEEVGRELAGARVTRAMVLAERGH